MTESHNMHEAVLSFWFDEIRPAQWWKADADVDALIERRFGELHRAAARAELRAWREAPRGRLAEVLLLDQFSRNLHRGSALAYVNDAMALALAQEAIAAHADASLNPRERSFLLMPFMHSESRSTHAEAETLFETTGVQDAIDSEQRHKAVIDRFGRFPHRNAVLGRESTPEEIEFLRQRGSRF